MSDHYFSKKPQSEEVSKTDNYTLRNHRFTFTSGAGVFSKRGIDFGSKLLIESFEAPEVEGDIMDLGCGYGPIGIALAYHYRERQFIMVDINERAISLAEKNAQQNDVSNVDIRQSDGFLNVSEKNFAAIVTNPPIRAGKKVIYPLFEESKNHLVHGGELWIVVQKKQGAPSIRRFLSSIFDAVEIVSHKKGYFILRAIRE